MTSFSDPHVIAALVAKLAAVSILISNVEYLFARRILTDGGILSWPVASLRHAWLISGWTGRLLGSLLAYPNVLVLIGCGPLLKDELMEFLTPYRSR